MTNALLQLVGDRLSSTE